MCIIPKSTQAATDYVEIIKADAGYKLIEVWEASVKREESRNAATVAPKKVGK